MSAGTNTRREPVSRGPVAVLENVATPKSAHTDELGEAVLDRLTKLIGVDEGDE